MAIHFDATVNGILHPTTPNDVEHLQLANWALLLFNMLKV